MGDTPSPGSPTGEHALLGPFVGEFDAEVTMWMQPGADPMVTKGVMTNTLDLGGRFLKQDYTGDELPFAPGQRFEGRGFWGFNAHAGRWEGFWIDSASTMMQNESGSYDAGARTWTMTGELLSGDQSFRKRSVVKLVNHDEHTLEMFFTGPDGEERKQMAIRYVRR